MLVSNLHSYQQNTSSAYCRGSHQHRGLIRFSILVIYDIWFIVTFPLLRVNTFSYIIWAFAFTIHIFALLPVEFFAFFL